MSMTKGSIFRERAIEHYIRSREKDVLPRFVSPPVFRFLWILLALCLLLGWIAANIDLPVSTAGAGLLVAGGGRGETQAVLFVAAEQARGLHPGERAQLQIGSADLQLVGSVTSVASGPLSPDQARQRYQLDGSLALLVTQPAVVVVVAPDAALPESSDAGSIVHAQIQVGEQSILSSSFS